MAQKKNESVADVEEKVVPSVVEKPAGSFVNTLWEQYELSTERADKLRENREDVYINAIREVIKFNKQYRKSIAELYDQGKKTNKELVTEAMQQLEARKAEVQEESVPRSEREELKTQLKEVSGQLEKLALTPVKAFFQVVDQLEDNFAKNAESNVAYARERRHAWLQVRKEYIQLAKKAHLNLLDRGKRSVKELVKTN